MKIVVMGATGRLGRLVIDELLVKIPASQLVAAVRDPGKAADLAARGIDIRLVDSSRPETLKAALAGTQKLLLISSGESGRLAYHRAVIEAAKKARVRLVAYTSLLHADRSKLESAADHKATERLLREAGLSHVCLRNGLYIENFTDRLAAAIDDGALIGSAGEGRVAAASRGDYAAAAAAVLLGAGHENKVYELVGESPFGMADLAAELSSLAGRTIAYEDLAPEEYGELLEAAGVPASQASVLVDAQLAIARGELNGSTPDLRRLIGRPTIPLRAIVASAYAALSPRRA